MPGRHVLDVDDVDRALDVGRDAPQHEAPHELGRRAPEVAARRARRPGRRRRPAARAPRSAAPRPPPRAWRRRTGCRARRATAWRSSAVPPSGAGPDGGDRGGVHDALDAPRAGTPPAPPASPPRWPRTARPRGARRLVEPATWNDARRRPRSARRTARRSVEVGDRPSRRRAPPSASRFEVARTVTRTSSPRATSARATCEPTNPVAPVTRVVGIASRGYQHYAHAPMARVAVVTDTTHYMPRALVERARICTRSRSTSPSRARPSARPTSPTSPTSTRASARRREMPGTSQPSVGDFLAVYEPLLEAGARHRLDPPQRRHLRHLRRRRAGPRPAVERGIDAGADRRARLRDRVRRARDAGDGRRERRRAPAAAPPRRPRRPRPAGAT